MLLSTPGNAASSGTQSFTVRVTRSNCNAEWGQALLEQPASHSQFPYQGIASFASKIESMKARSSRRAARRALQELRYPQLLEHDGKRFAAYVNAINGTPTGIIDTDSLDFTLGSSMNLTTKSEFETISERLRRRPKRCIRAGHEAAG